MTTHPEEQLAVIFDIDGVLVDSYRVHYESWQKAAREFGFTITEQQFAETFGQTSRSIIRHLGADTIPTDGAVRQIDDYKEAAYRAIIAADFPTMPGAIDLIDALSEAGFALAVGSSGPSENVQLALDKLQRRSVFSADVSGSDVRQGKPDPEVFQVAGKKLGIDPRYCAVIEDAAAGVAAANAAGMLSVALVSTGHLAGEYGDADHVVYRLDELSPQRLREWIIRR